MIEEYLSQSQYIGNQPSNFIVAPVKNKCTPPNPGTLKINTDVALAKENIGIDIIIRNHLGISFCPK